MGPAAKPVVLAVSALLAMGTLLGTGLQHYEKGEFDQAVADFTKIIDSHKPNPYTDDALYWRSLSYLALKNEPKARADLITVLTKYPASDYAALAQSKLLELFIADPAVRTTLKDAVDGLIKQLGDREFSVREDAGRRLVELGDFAVPALEAAAASPDAEISMRASKALAELREKRALAAFENLDVRISLKADQRPLMDVFKDLENQTGNRFDFTESTPPDKPISCDLADVTFWQALDEVGRQAGVYVNAGSRLSGALSIYAGSSGRANRPTSYAGPCKFTIQGINKSFNFEDNNRRLSLHGEFWVEPRLRCKGFSNPTIKRVTDDLGTELSAPDRSGGGINSMDSGVRGSFNVEVQNVGPDVHELTLVEGSMSLQFPISFDTLEVKDLPKPKTASAQRGAYGITVTDASRADNSFNVSIILRRTFVPNEPRRWENYNRSDFSLVDAKGNVIPPNGVDQRGGNSNETMQEWTGNLRFQIPVDVEPASVRFIYPSRLITKSVPFRLEHVPVP